MQYEFTLCFPGKTTGEFIAILDTATVQLAYYSQDWMRFIIIHASFK